MRRYHAHLLKLGLRKVYFLYKISKNEHLNGKNIRPAERLEPQNNFPLILAMKPKQINKIWRLSRPPF